MLRSFTNTIGITASIANGAARSTLRPIIESTPSFGILSRVGKRFGHELAPRYKVQKKKQKGRLSVRTGGSSKGSILNFGKYGVRLKSEGERISAAQLRAADNVLVREVKALGAKLWRRICTNIAVCIKGNATRMGKGKGDFEYWMARVPTGKVIFEIDGPTLHEKSAKDVLRRACEKLPGVYEFVDRSVPPRLGLKAVKEVEAPTNILETLEKNPTKKYEAFVKSKQPDYKDFTGRKSR
ncbi:hypothetical protein B5S29_g1057 [[Candida] boidinii]|nr:hypothetical protein B5S29_g1057 [[Candida] boidinii]